jgi:hypothetical protein
MCKEVSIVFWLLLVGINLPAQIIYDTIPEEESIFGGYYWEELFIFNDFGSQASAYINNINFSSIDCPDSLIVVKTTFGRSGELENTRITKSVTPECDSIAFYFVEGFKDWLPGLGRGKIIDISFSFPIIIDSAWLIKQYSTYDFFSFDKESFMKRQEIFDFFYSEDYDQEIINNYDFFKGYIAETFQDSQYVYILTDYKLKRKESIVMELDYPKSKTTHLLLRNQKKEWLLYDYNLKRTNIRIPKNDRLFLLFYEENTTPLIQTMILTPDNDTTINLELKKYTKGRLIEEINAYSP